MSPRPRPAPCPAMLGAVVAIAAGCSAPVATVASIPPPPPVEATPTISTPRPLDALAKLGRPITLVIFDTWGGLGASYDFSARLEGSPEGYDAVVMLHVVPMSPKTNEVGNDRYEGKRVVVPRERIDAFVAALRSAKLGPGESSGIELSPLDDNGASDVLLFPASGPSVTLHRGPTDSFSIDRGLRHRVTDPAAVKRAYRALMETFEIVAWVNRIQREAFP